VNKLGKKSNITLTREAWHRGVHHRFESMSHKRKKTMQVLVAQSTVAQVVEVLRQGHITRKRN